MIIHASIPADDPERVARVIAELWRGESFPFLAGTFIAMAGDGVRGSQIEVTKRGNEIVPAETMDGVSGQRVSSHRHTRKYTLIT